jgi:hypothetical protein
MTQEEMQNLIAAQQAQLAQLQGQQGAQQSTQPMQAPMMPAPAPQPYQNPYQQPEMQQQPQYGYGPPPQALVGGSIQLPIKLQLPFGGTVRCYRQFEVPANMPVDQFIAQLVTSGVPVDVYGQQQQNGYGGGGNGYNRGGGGYNNGGGYRGGYNRGGGGYNGGGGRY